MFCACSCMFDKKVQTSLCFLHRARKPLFNTLVALTPKNIVNTSVVWCFCLLRFKILQAHTTWTWKEQRLENLWSQCGRLLPFTLMQVDRLSREQQRLKALLLRSGATTDVSEYLSTRFSWAGKRQQRCVFGKNQTGPAQVVSAKNTADRFSHHHETKATGCNRYRRKAVEALPFLKAIQAISCMTTKVFSELVGFLINSFLADWQGLWHAGRDNQLVRNFPLQICLYSPSFLSVTQWSKWCDIDR